jgi:hypothetical protein
MMTPIPDRILWCYGEYQILYGTVDGVDFQQGLPDLGTLDPREKHLIILDDLMDETDQRVASLFTKKSHHRNISVMYIVQNLFHRGKHHRTISLNAQKNQETEGKKSRTGSTFKTKVETTKGAVVNMESTYYNVVAPASYGGLSKFKPKGYTKKEVREWLQSQDTYTLHKPTRRRFTRRRIVVYGIDHQWQADLVDLAKSSSYNKGFKYLVVKKCTSCSLRNF